jgi:hypothetical protein
VKIRAGSLFCTPPCHNAAGDAGCWLTMFPADY